MTKIMFILLLAVVLASCSYETVKLDETEFKIIEDIKEIEKETEIEQTIEHKNLAVQLNSSFNISISSNPTTGFKVSIEKIDDNYLRLVNTTYKPDRDEPCVGCGRTNQYEFEPLKVGKTELVFHYCQPWQCEETLVRIIKYNITITDEKEHCESDDDCILIIDGCRDCPACKSYKATDPEVIAVNKNTYDKCPPRPKDLICVACLDSISYDTEKAAICVNNKCEKRANNT